MNSHSFILFEVGATRFGMLSSSVTHIEMVDQITAVPNAPASVEGVFRSRGQVIPVLNLRVLFGSARAEPTVRTRLVVLAGPDRAVALLVDSARDFCRIPPTAIQSIGDAMPGVRDHRIAGVATLTGGTLVILLEAAAFLDLQPASLPWPEPALAVSPGM